MRLRSLNSINIAFFLNDQSLNYLNILNVFEGVMELSVCIHSQLPLRTDITSDCAKEQITFQNRR